MTFLLLEITAKLLKRNAKTLRLVLSSALGGAYSLIILAEIPQYMAVLSKIFASLIIVLTAFGFVRLKSFVSAVLVFLFSNFLFLGIIAGLHMLLKSDSLRVDNTAVYLDISARGLLLSAFVSYVLSCVIVRLYNNRLSSGEVYTLEIESNNKTVSLFAFSDSGNRLHEPFSNYPVIIADSKKVSELLSDNKTRLIPASTINNKSFLISFKPDRVTVKTDKGREIIENVYIALSDDIESESFSAVINPEILSV